MAWSETRSASLVFSHRRKLAGWVMGMPAYSSRWKASTAVQSRSRASTSASIKSSWELPVLTTMRARPRLAITSRTMAAAACAAASDVSRLEENTCTCIAPAENVLMGDDIAYLSSGLSMFAVSGVRRPRGSQQADNQGCGEGHDARSDEHRLEGVAVGSPADQKGGQDRAKAGAGAAHAADRGNLRGWIEIGGQRQCHRRPCRITE